MWVNQVVVTARGGAAPSLVVASDEWDDAVQRAVWHLHVDEAVSMELVDESDAQKALEELLPATVAGVARQTWSHPDVQAAVTWMRQTVGWSIIDTDPPGDAVPSATAKRFWSRLLAQTHVYLAPRDIEGHATGPAGWMVRADLDPYSPNDHGAFDAIVDETAAACGLTLRFAGLGDEEEW